MPDPSPQTLTTHNPMRGIAFKLGSVAFLLSMASMLKASEGVPPGQLVFFRSFFAIVPIIVFLAWRGELLVGLKTKRLSGHLWRSVIGVTSMGCGFFALTKLPLPEAVAIGYAMPLLLVVFGAIFLKEKVRLYRWSAVIVGMVGVGIIVWPRLTVFTGGGEANELAVGALASLTSAVFGAIAALHVRQLVKSEPSATIVLYFSLCCSVVGLATLPFGWVWPTWELGALLVGAGIAGGIGQIFITEAYRHADVSVVAPFEYTSLILSIAVGYVLFSDIPTIEMLIGAVIVVGAGLFIIWREHALGLERRRAREVTPTAPGA